MNPLKKWSKSKGISLAQIGRDTNYSTSLVCHISTGRRPATLAFQTAFVKAYGAAAYYEVFGKPDAQEQFELLSLLGLTNARLTWEVTNG